MTETFVVRTTRACGCVPDADSLVKSGYIDGPIVSALLRLERWYDFAVWQNEFFKFHGKGLACAIKRANKIGATIEPFDKANWIEDWTAIDLSKPIRQGRAMSAGYQKTLEERGGPPTEWRDVTAPTCVRHYRRCLGTFVPAPPRVIAGRTVDKKLVAYASLIRTDNLMILSQILGHAEYLSYGAVPALLRQLLFMLYARGTEEQQKAPVLAGIEAMLYGGFGDGSPGLRDFKRRLGFTSSRLVTVATNEAAR